MSAEGTPTVDLLNTTTIKTHKQKHILSLLVPMLRRTAGICCPPELDNHKNNMSTFESFFFFGGGALLAKRLNTANKS